VAPTTTTRPGLSRESSAAVADGRLPAAASRSGPPSWAAAGPAAIASAALPAPATKTVGAEPGLKDRVERAAAVPAASDPATRSTTVPGASSPVTLATTDALMTAVPPRTSTRAGARRTSSTPTADGSEELLVYRIAPPARAAIGPAARASAKLSPAARYTTGAAPCGKRRAEMATATAYWSAPPRRSVETRDDPRAVPGCAPAAWIGGASTPATSATSPNAIKNRPGSTSRGRTCTMALRVALPRLKRKRTVDPSLRQEEPRPSGHPSRAAAWRLGLAVGAGGWGWRLGLAVGAGGWGWRSGPVGPGIRY
jgi:hypothetical protein